MISKKMISEDDYHPCGDVSDPDFRTLGPVDRRIHTNHRLIATEYMRSVTRSDAAGGRAP